MVTSNKDSFKLLKGANKAEKLAMKHEKKLSYYKDRRRTEELKDPEFLKLREKLKIKKREATRELDMSSRREIRSRNFDFNIRLDTEQRRKVDLPIDKVIRGMSVSHQKNDSMVKANLKNQEDKFKERLEERKKNSFQRSLRKANTSKRSVQIPSTKEFITQNVKEQVGTSKIFFI